MRNTTQKFIIDAQKPIMNRYETVQLDENPIEAIRLEDPKTSPKVKETDKSLAVPNYIVTDEQKRMSIGLSK